MTGKIEKRGRQSAKLILWHRTKAGMKQSQVAQQLGMDQSNYAKYERGERVPNEETLMQLAKILGCFWKELQVGREAEFTGMLNRLTRLIAMGDESALDELTNDLAGWKPKTYVVDELQSFFVAWAENYFSKKHPHIYTTYLEDPTYEGLCILYSTYLRKLDKDYPDDTLVKSWSAKLPDLPMEEEDIILQSNDEDNPFKSSMGYKLAFCIGVFLYLSSSGQCSDYITHDALRYAGVEPTEDNRYQGAQTFAFQLLIPFVDMLTCAFEYNDEEGDICDADFIYPLLGGRDKPYDPNIDMPIEVDENS